MVVKGRFAPSPTGRMHLGNVYAALMSWLFVKSAGGKWLLRIEDLDPGRSRPEYARALEDDLLWLGLEWDEGGLANRGDAGPYSQSRRSETYAEAFESLREAGRVYPCTCTRADILATQAPHQSDGTPVYGGRCRPAEMPAATPVPEPQTRHSMRLWVPDEDVEFHDLICGPQRVRLSRECGDFVIRRSDGAWGYQLAVVVDDAMMGVTQVVRGNDLLTSAAGQCHIYDLLGYARPEFGHLPLLCNEAGQRLSKRDASLDMGVLRREFSPEALLGRIAAMARLRPDSTPVSLSDLLDSFNPALLSRESNITVI
ncbi:MAG: tRNA glutamyl-Q(34) synthetase GluQRS [Muribaculaceae bacterium]|nr:tRNA glutamyl-Q(34) synthetase GluQRS [Muribaculaceae bacterium]